MTDLSKEEKQRIVEEEQVRAEARQMFSKTTTTQKRPLSPKQKRLLISSTLILIAIPFVVNYWYVLIPLILLVTVWGWKKITISKKKKIYASGIIIALFAILNGSLAFADRAPSIKILEPTDNHTLQADKVVLKGKVTPHNATVKLNGNVLVSNDGAFEQTVNLLEEKNTITIYAENGGKKQIVSLTVNRTFTEEEKAERERLAQEKEKKAQEQKAIREKQAKENAILQAKQAEIDAKNQADANARKDGDVAGACAEMWMEKNVAFTSPATAKFGTWNTTPLGKNKYAVTSYVDAQNGFGALVRNGYTCNVTVITPETFMCSTSCKF